MRRVRYELLELLGRGGFGEVRRARMHGEDNFTREVAIKLLHPDAGADAARRLRDEARLLGLLRHPAIVQVLDLTSIGGRPAVVMELIEGMPLSAYAARGQPIPPRAAAQLVAQVAQVLDAAWSAQGPRGRPLRVLHRDIKPSNLLLTERGDVKVLDFGVAQARFDTREASTSKEVYGTVTYMAPERLKASGGPSADVFALGVVFIELLTGVRFGPTPTDATQYAQHLSRALSRLPSDASTLAPLLRVMLAYAADERASAAVVCETLRLVEPQLRAGVSLAEWSEVTVKRYLARRASDGATTNRRTWTTTSRQVFTRTLALLSVLAIGAGLALASAMVALPSSPRHGQELPRQAPQPQPKVRPSSPEPLQAPSPEAPPKAASAGSTSTPGGSPTLEPATPPAARADVTLIGDLTQITLAGQQGRFVVPGPVPPGRYVVEASFPRWGKRAQDQVSVPEGGAVIRCMDGFGSCRVE